MPCAAGGIRYQIDNLSNLFKWTDKSVINVIKCSSLSLVYSNIKCPRVVYFSHYCYTSIKFYVHYIIREITTA